jgi:hypothetical protein
MSRETLREAAIGAVNLFDQANTGNAIGALGYRGGLAISAINDLREVLNRWAKQTILTGEQANDHGEGLWR